MKMFPMMQEHLQFNKLQTSSTLSSVITSFSAGFLPKLAQLLSNSKTSVWEELYSAKLVAGCWGVIVSTRHGVLSDLSAPFWFELVDSVAFNSCLSEFMYFDFVAALPAQNKFDFVKLHKSL